MPSRRLALLAFAAAFAVAATRAPAASGAEGFVAGTEDVPLMAGLTPVAGSSLVFDKPQGRIVEAQAKGRVSRDRVRAFYAGTLPQLGWTAAGEVPLPRLGQGDRGPECLQRDDGDEGAEHPHRQQPFQTVTRSVIGDHRNNPLPTC